MVHDREFQHFLQECSQLRRGLYRLNVYRLGVLVVSARELHSLARETLGFFLVIELVRRLLGGIVKDESATHLDAPSDRSMPVIHGSEGGGGPITVTLRWGLIFQKVVGESGP